MKELVLTTALAVSLACPASAHSDTEMTEDNELFDRCTYAEGIEVCDIKREHMVCEPAAKYDNKWSVFVEQNGYPFPVNQGQITHEKLGPIGYISIRLDEHYGHTYIYIVLEDVVCLGSIAHFIGVDPAA